MLTYNARYSWYTYAIVAPCLCWNHIDGMMHMLLVVLLAPLGWRSRCDPEAFGEAWLP